MEIFYTKKSKSVNVSYNIIYLFLIKVLSRTQKLILSVFNSRVEINENYISKKKVYNQKSCRYGCLDKYYGQGLNQTGFVQIVRQFVKKVDTISCRITITTS